MVCSRVIVADHFLFCLLLFFFNDTATTEIYTLSLHDALPISFPKWAVRKSLRFACRNCLPATRCSPGVLAARTFGAAQRKKRSEEHTSELQSQSNLVCRLLLEKKQT